MNLEEIEIPESYLCYRSKIRSVLKYLGNKGQCLSLDEPRFSLPRLTM